MGLKIEIVRFLNRFALNAVWWIPDVQRYSRDKFDELDHIERVLSTWVRQLIKLKQIGAAYLNFSLYFLMGCLHAESPAFTQEWANIQNAKRGQGRVFATQIRPNTTGDLLIEVGFVGQEFGLLDEWLDVLEDEVLKRPNFV